MRLMPTMRDVKIYGGLGALLSLLSFVPHIGIVLSIAGLVLILIAIKYLSDMVNEPQLFKNMIIAMVAYIVGIVIFFLVVFGTLLSAIFSAPHTPKVSWLPVLLGVISGLVVLWLACIVGGVFIKRTYDRVAEITGIDLFKTTGLLYLIGSALLIVIIGGIILLVAKVLEAVSFFSIKEESPASPQPPPPPPPVS
ncbi:MAG: hypothetical protein DRN04_09280 [Thermoprotei archaeon]|nr:MAG: hypothetical protein DRN04_09280 [Thermoprotei archaeon]